MTRSIPIFFSILVISIGLHYLNCKKLETGKKDDSEDITCEAGYHSEGDECVPDVADKTEKEETKKEGEIEVMEESSTLRTDPIDLSGIQTDRLSLTRHYSLDPLDIPVQVLQYNLPLQTGQIVNFSDFSAKIPLSEGALDLIGNNGFVVTKGPFNPEEEYITSIYERLKFEEIPIFITSDSLLHLYHIQFDETLRQIEEGEFYHRIWEISMELVDDSIHDYNRETGDLKEASRINTAYFSVGLKLLQPTPDQLCKDDSKCGDPGTAGAYFKEEDLQRYIFTVPPFVKDDVEKELDLIEKHTGFSKSPIFKYNEDYSQYLPRGHYTRSERLKNYFKGLMWYGRMAFLLKGCESIPNKCLIPEDDARIQTMAAGLIAHKFAEDQGIREKWDRIYAVTAFYVGLSDDLGPYEYIEGLNAVFNGAFDPNELRGEKVEGLKAELIKHPSPRIYGGTGECKVEPPFTPEKVDECIGKTVGMRLMGRRFIPDSYMFTNLVGFKYPGNSEPFTRVLSQGGYIRGFPRGLDVMAILGSKRAMDLLDELDDSNYEYYEQEFNKLKEEFNAFGPSDWNKNLYWSRLFSLKALIKEFGQGYPTFMQTTGWRDKELTTALASWAELRHDTILYAKQSYTPTVTGIPPEPPPVIGYVEPVPEFYNRLLALTRMTNKGLDEMGVLDGAAKSRLAGLERILARLVNISERELKNEELSEDDYDFIKNFDGKLVDVIEEVDDKAKKTTIIADVHTDQNSGEVLEEGIGYVDLITVAYRVPDGRILIGAGPVMSYYEFRHPMGDRLTDERWREMLGSTPPKRPEWSPNIFSE